MTNDWYCQIDETVYGPLAAQELKRMAGSGKLGSEDLVKKTAAGKWIRAGQVKGLAFESPHEAADKEPGKVQEPEKVQEPAVQKTCPECQAVLQANAVLCVSCGLNLLTGAKLSAATSSGKRSPKRTSRALLFCAIGAILLVAVSVPLYLFVLRDGLSKGNKEPAAPGNPAGPEAKRPVSGDAPSVQPALESGFRVTGSATFKVISRRVIISDVTYQQARLQLQLVNSTDYPIQLGTRMLLIETNADGTAFDGVLVGLRLPRDADSKSELWHTKGAYLVGTTESRYAGGGQYTAGSIQALLYLNSHEVTDDSKDDKLPEQSGVRGQTPLAITLNRSSWLQDNVRGAVRCVLPEIGVVTREGVDRYRLIVTFKKTGADEAPWEAGRHDWIRVDKTELGRVLDSPTDMVTKVLAANWWMEFDPAGARPALVRVGQTQSEGTLLSVCMSLLGQEKDDGLRAHAAKLLQASGTPPGICIAAANYLAKLGQDPDLAPLLSLASGPNDKVAREIIIFLGSLNTPGAIKGLETLLQDPNLNARHAQIKANLDHAKKRGTEPK